MFIYDHLLSWDTAVRVLQILGGLGFSATAYLAWKNYQLNQHRQVSERFGQAVTMLADEKLATRLGGIYLLERIAKDPKEEHPDVMEILAAFIRDNSVSYASQEMFENEPPPRLGQDIQSALTIIGRRETGYDMVRLDLSGAHLSSADLRGADLNSVKLLGADLRSADLSDANLGSADLSDAELRGADLSGAELFSTYLIGADLSGANFSGADLSYADLSVTTLLGAHLSSADLRDADLCGANLSNAYLFEANLRKANLMSADLRGADLHEADLEDIKFNEKTQWPSLEILKQAKNVPEQVLNALSPQEEPEPLEAEKTDASSSEEVKND